MAGQVQLGNPVKAAVETLQIHVLGQIQAGQLVIGAVQRLKIGEHLQTFQTGQSQAGEVQLRNRLALLLCQDAVRTHAAQVAGLQQPGLKLLVPEYLCNINISHICAGLHDSKGRCRHRELTNQSNRGQRDGYFFDIKKAPF